MNLKSPDPAKLRQVLDTVYGVDATVTKDGVEFPDTEHPDLPSWLRSDWPDLVQADGPLVSPAELDQLKT